MNRSHALVVVTAAFVCCVAVFAPALFTGKLLAIGDGLIETLPALFAPWRLWDPNIMLGYPLYADPNQAAFYPLRLLRFVPDGFNIYVISAFAIAGAAVFGYVFDLTEDRVASFAGAASFTFGGFMVSHLGHPMIDHPTAWTLVALWTLGRYRRSRRVLWLAGTPVALALSISSGQPQIVLFGLVILGAHTVFAELPQSLKRRSWSSIVAATAPLGAIALGLGLGAAFYLPTVQLGEASTRAVLTFPSFVQDSLPLDLIPVLLTFPYIAGGAQLGVFEGTLISAPAGSFTEISIFVSAATIALACAGVSARPRGFAIFWAAIAIGGFALAVGDRLPFAAWTYTLAPFNQFRIPGRHAYEITLASSIVAGLGIAELRARPFRRPLGFGLALTVLLYGVAAREVFLRNPLILNEPAVTWFLAAALGQLALLVAALFARPQNAARLAALAVVGGTSLFVVLANWRDAPPQSVANTPPYVTALRGLPLSPGQRVYAYSTDPIPKLRPNLPALWGVPNVAGYTPLQLRDVRSFMNMSPGGELLDIGSPATDLAAVRYIAVPVQPSPVQSDNQPFGPGQLAIFLSAAGARSASLGFERPETGDRIAIVSALGDSIETLQGTVVASVVVRFDDGGTQRFFLRAGIDTAEIAYDRPGVTGRMRHARPMVFARGALTTWFQTTLPLARREAIRSLEIAVPLKTKAFNLREVSIVDPRTHRAFPFSEESELFADDRHFRHVEDSDGVAIFENLRARLRAWVEYGSPPAQSKDRSSYSVFLDRLEPQERSATVVCRSDCFFVSSDHMNRDWRATVDERPERLISSHGVLATVKLTKGRHLVSMSYVPSTLYEGIEISAASCALTILLCGIASFARRRTPDVR